MRKISLFFIQFAILGASRHLEAVVISEIHYHPPSSFGNALEFVEVFNPSPEPVPLGGWKLRGAVDFAFAEGEVLAPGGFLVVCKDCKKLQAVHGGPLAVYAGEFNGSLENGGELIELVDPVNAVVDAVDYDDRAPWPENADGRGGSIERRCPDAAGNQSLNWTSGFLPTPGSSPTPPQCPPPAYETPRVVISEIHYHPEESGPVRPATEDGEEEEFLEVHNPGSSPVNIDGWRLNDGVLFQFPEGTVLLPGGYLVICRDEGVIRSRYGITNTAGDFQGQLSNHGERVAIVDAEGKLVDSVRYSDSGEWPYGPDGQGQSLERAILTADGNDPAHWRPSGLSSANFQRLSVEGQMTTIPAPRILLTLDGPGEFLVDDVILEDLAAPGVNLLANGSFISGLDGWTVSGTHTPSSWAPAEGVNGSEVLRLVSTGACPEDGCGVDHSVSAPIAGVLSPVARYRLSLQVKHQKGSPFLKAEAQRGLQVQISQVATPGRPRSSAAAASVPFISNVSRFPVEPRSTDRVWITARVRPPDAAVQLEYDAAGVTATIVLRDDGLFKDGKPGDGIFGGELPPFPHNSRVHFRIQATLGAETAEHPRPLHPGFPLPQERDGYYVNDLQVESPLPVYQVLVDGLDGADPEDLNNLIDCDTLRPGAFASKGDLYPSVRIRSRGNTACLVYKLNLKVVFERGRFFRGLRKINLNGMWTDKGLVREHLAWEFHREIGAPYFENEYVRVHLNGLYHGLFLYIEHPDDRYLERNGLDENGNLYKSNEPPRGIENPIGVPKQRSLSAYQGAWEETTSDPGDFSDIAAFIDGMHADGTRAGGPTAAFWGDGTLEEMSIDYQLGQVVLNNIDSFAKNHFLYHDLASDRWGLIAWDLDLTFGKFFNPDAVGPGRPVGTLNDFMLSDPLVQGDLNPWFGASVFGNPLYHHWVNFFFRAGGGRYQRAYLTRLWDIIEEKYRNEVYDPRLDALLAFLATEQEDDFDRWARYPSNVPGFPPQMDKNLTVIKRQIRLHRDFLRTYIRAFHPAITSHPRVKITEVMFWPEGDDDDLEYIEFANVGPGAANLAGWTLPAVGFEFPAGSSVLQGESFILARSPEKLRQRYARLQLPTVFGPYRGRLANEGEELRLRDAGPGYPAQIDFLRYESKRPWPEVDPGQSIELNGDPGRVDNDDPALWSSSAVLGGSPGKPLAEFIRADSDRNAEVNLSDAIFTLNYLFLAGPTPPCLDASDTDDNDRVEITDPIITLQHLFLGGPEPALPYPEKGADPTPAGLDCRS